MSEQKTVNVIQSKIDSLVEERESILKEQDVLRTKFDQFNMRLCEINGSIQVLVELFGKQAKESSDDTENQTSASSDTNEG